MKKGKLKFLLIAAEVILTVLYFTVGWLSSRLTGDAVAAVSGYDILNLFVIVFFAAADVLLCTAMYRSRFTKFLVVQLVFNLILSSLYLTGIFDFFTEGIFTMTLSETVHCIAAESRDFAIVLYYVLFKIAAVYNIVLLVKLKLKKPERGNENGKK